MKVLVAYGKRGGTEALARAVANGLVEAGHAVDVMPATQVDALDRWDVVVVGGTPYAWFWHRDGQRFIKRNVEDLFQAQPPLIIRLIDTVKANMEAAIPDPPPTPVAPPSPPVRAAAPVRDRTVGVHHLVTWLCLFTGVTAAAGGATVMRAGDAYLTPGLILFLVVGVGNLVAALLEARRVRGSELAVSVAGSTITGWNVMQLVMFGSLSWVQLLSFLVGVLTIAGAAWLWLVRGPPPSSPTVAH